MKSFLGSSILAVLVLLTCTQLAFAADSAGDGPRFDRSPTLSAVGPVLSLSIGSDDSACAECKGGVIALTLQYDGATTATITVRDKKKTYFSGTVNPGETFSFEGTGKDGKFEKNELTLLIDGEENTAIHVSCSKPVNPGLQFGEFTIIEAVSKDGSSVCPVVSDGCQECKGGVIALTLRYDGATTATITVKDNKKTYFSGTVNPGETFSFEGTGKDGKFEKNELTILIDGAENTAIHVSCSKPINPGLQFGEFTIVEAVSKDGGRVCPLTPMGGVKMRLEKTASVEEIGVGQQFEYTLTVRSSSTSETTATNVVVSDLLPGGISLAGALPGGATFDAVSRLITWNAGSLEPNEARALSFTVKALTAGDPVNCAQVLSMDQMDSQSTSGNGFYNGEQDDDCAPVIITDPEINVSLKKSVSNPYPSVGDVVTFAIIVANDGPADATNVKVQDYMPAGLSYVPGTASVAPGIVFDSSDMTWVIAKMVPGDMRSLTFQADANMVGEHINCAEVRAADQQDTNSTPGEVSGTVLDCPWAPTLDLEDDEDYVRIWITEEPQIMDAVCYIVADNDLTRDGSSDVFAKLSTDAMSEIIIGETGTANIEAIAFNPWNGVLFGGDGPRLGTINLNTGVFTEIGLPGSGFGYDQNGEYVSQEFDDIDGLTFHPHTGELFASIRNIERDVPDLLIQIDPATGLAVSDAFGPGLDYVAIKGIQGLTDVDDIAIDPVDGTMYGVNNYASFGSRLVTINPLTGVFSDVRALPVANVEGLGFFGDGTLFGTGGDSFNNILIIDKQTLEIEIVASIGTYGNSDYESIDCLVTSPNRLRMTVFADADGNGTRGSFETALGGVPVEVFRDLNGNGIVDPSDRKLTVVTTSAQGKAEFSTPATGAFVLRAEGTDGTGELTAHFNGFGESTDGELGIASTATATETSDALPTSFELTGNFPNPFNPTTTISFAAPTSGRVRLAVFDLLGREVQLLLDRKVSAGHHNVSFEAGLLPSGTYLYRLESDTGAVTRTMTLLK
jgi:uncharacterized repeat protein (TIGR01451 family)